MRTPETSGRWGVLANITLLASSIVVCSIVGEFIIRGLYADHMVLFPRYHTAYQYGDFTIRGICPNMVYRHTSPHGSWEFVTNSRGFRNTEEFSYAKPENTCRVMCLGDSHTQGYEVAQHNTYSAVLERWLNAHGFPAQVLNAGVSGFSTAEELVLLREEGVRYAPDVVVIGFFANDLEDNLRSGLFDLGDRDTLVTKAHAYVPGVRIQALMRYIPLTEYLGQHSYFYSLLFNSVWEYFKSRSRSEAVRQTAFEYAIATYQELEDREMRLGLALFKVIAEVCRTIEAQLIVLDIPQRDGPHGFVTSLHPEMREGLRRLGVDVVVSEDILGTFAGAAEFHVPRGQDHISEFTHAHLGVALGQRILAARR